ncbi:MAG: protein-disulfide reductase DsbD family protein [Rhodospirillaceae bacterium]
MAGLFRLLVVLALIFAGPAPALAAASPWWETDHGAVRLVAASDAAGDSDRLAFGLHFRMNPGWKIYWRSPGDAGFPPQPSWAGSANVAGAEIAWPAPKRFSVLGFETLGYEGEVVLPLAVTVFEPGKPVRLRGTVNYLTCDDICVPYEAPVALDLPAGALTTTREAGLIDAFAARVPAADGAGLRINAAEVETSGSGAALRIEVVADAPLQRPDVYVEGPPQISFAAPQVQMRDGGRAALLRVAVGVPRGRTADLGGQSVTLTAVDGDRATERTLTLAPPAAAAPAAPPPPPVPAAPPGFALILGLALLGGVILNLMPCVLPVLSLKLLSLVDARGRAPAAVRRRFLAAAAGILASFALLATLAVALKEAGLAVGWGIQFQQPVFLAAMSFVVVLFAANLWGFFHVGLPAAVGDAAAGAAMRSRDSLSGHFLTGALATLLATPCSAPFVGSAVGFALARGPGEIYAIFAALGVGLAAPYLAVAAWPGAARLLPRPGRWMAGLRVALGVALIGTAAWLLSVVAAQSGAAIALSLAALLMLLVAVLWALHRLAAPWRRAAWSAVAVLALAMLALPAAWRHEEGQVAAEGGDRGPWRPFSAAALAEAVASGSTVVVDVTADWCLTCKVNKAAVLDRGEVRSRLGAAGVVALQADWTRPDPAIAAYLAGFGRYGIPFNAVYGPNAPRGIALPELLTPEAMTRALDAASGRRVAGARAGGG